MIEPSSPSRKVIEAGFQDVQPAAERQVAQWVSDLCLDPGTAGQIGWGFDVFGQATPLLTVGGTTSTASAIATGGFHTLAIQTVPEPGLTALMAAGLVGLSLARRYRRTSCSDEPHPGSVRGPEPSSRSARRPNEEFKTDPR